MCAPESKSSAEELADLIDQLMAQGSGHVNIVGNGSELKVDTVKSTDICGTKGACCQPTELEPEDDEF
ncbi:hypothetical protein [Ruminococcus flavefaciens]|jgi:hypothetical protein|uniref:Uncharacterized protein n=1 Tax=Ruminococcus flavefaciens TaxID=1265 RepID=A0A1K1P114_RUMFL|nr:hypothetical protein [Ruminococcus flavefaciens]SFW41260.1 hypothetical protein SAMN02910280_2421 [Ruminococcus flavefaciens]